MIVVRHYPTADNIHLVHKAERDMNKIFIYLFTDLYCRNILDEKEKTIKL